MARASTVSILRPRTSGRAASSRAPEVAVLLNANARAVNARVVRAIADVVPARDFYVSRTFEEAHEIAHEVMGRGYDTVLTGGGDGTFVGFYNALRVAAAIRQLGVAHGSVLAAPPPLSMPRMGALRLGTGNALAGYTGASSLRRSGVLDDILQTRAGRLTSTRRMDLVEVEGVFAPFSGVGLDALIMNNYIRWKKLLANTPFKAFGEGGFGYFFSVAGFSIPESLLRSLPDIEIINTGDEAIPVDVHGKRCGRPIPSGAVLYRGPARLASVGTCPYWGLGFKIFPAADTMPGRMQLRVTDLSVFETLWNLPAIWNGTYRAPSIRDYLLTSVSIRSERKMPFQLGGDAMGYRDQVEFNVAEQPAELIDFSRRALAA